MEPVKCAYSCASQKHFPNKNRPYDLYIFFRWFPLILPMMLSPQQTIRYTFKEQRKYSKKSNVKPEKKKNLNPGKRNTASIFICRKTQTPSSSNQRKQVGVLFQGKFLRAEVFCIAFVSI